MLKQGMYKHREFADKEGVVHDAVGVAFVCELPIHKRRAVTSARLQDLEYQDSDLKFLQAWI
jgi:hypothetical protein